jgi:hypothetical protein
MSEISTLPSLFRLPSSILSVIFSKYLTIDSVCVLDIAVSETRSRRILLNLFLSAEVVFEDNRDRYGRDFISWSKERGKELSSAKMWEYIRNDDQHARSNKDAEVFFLWLQKRSVQVKHASLVGWGHVTDAGMRALGESCSRLGN